MYDARKAESGMHVVPEGEFKCIWMTAGIISYKLCDYQFRCEVCPFDIVMRKAPANSSGPRRSQTAKRKPRGR